MFIEKLEKIINEKNITMNRLAKNAGFSQTSTDRWKKGSLPSVEALIKVCKYLNVSADYLLDLDTGALPPILTDQEQELLEHFRHCDDGTKKAACLFVKSGSKEQLKQETLLNSKILFQNCVSMIFGAIACVVVMPVAAVLVGKRINIV